MSKINWESTGGVDLSEEAMLDSICDDAETVIAAWERVERTRPCTYCTPDTECHSCAFAESVSQCVTFYEEAEE